MLQLILRIRMNRHLNFKHWWLFPSSLLSLCVFGVYLFTSFHHKVLLLSKAAGIYINVQVSDVFFFVAFRLYTYIQLYVAPMGWHTLGNFNGELYKSEVLLMATTLLVVKAEKHISCFSSKNKYMIFIKYIIFINAEKHICFSAFTTSSVLAIRRTSLLKSSPLSCLVALMSP